MDKGEWGLDLNLASRHSERTYTGRVEDRIKRNEKYNEENYGLGLVYGYKDWVDIKGGFFRNSYDITSYYIGASIHKDFYFGECDQWLIAPGIQTILTTGYDDTPDNAPVVAPIPIPSIQLGHVAFNVNVGYVPFGDVDFFTFQAQVNMSKIRKFICR